VRSVSNSLAEKGNVGMVADSWRLDIERLDDIGERHDRKFVVALARGLEVLRAFTPSEGLLGNQEIAARTGLAKATVSRLTYTLTTLGYLAHIDRLEKYQLAPGALAIGYSTLANMRIRQVAKPHMQALANYTGASVALGTRDRLNAIYIEFCRGKSATLLRLDVGARIPLATTAMGRGLLAGLPAKDRQRMMREIARREGGRWTKMRPGIERALRDIDNRGFSVSVGEWQSDINAVGVPLMPPDGSGVFAFNCGAPAFHFTRAQLENEIGPRLLNMTRNIEAELRGP
jgi:DNA-binding IclR family transcriptional regulator